MPSTPHPRRAFWIGAGCAATVLLIWTSFILVARSSASRSLGPLDIAWLRFAFSGLVALPWLVWRWPRFVAAMGGTRRLAIRRACALAATAGFGYCALAYSGFFFAPVAHAAVLLPGLLPLWTALLAWWVLSEPLGRGRKLGLGLIACGGLLVGSGSLKQAFDGSSVWIGDLMFIAASLIWALYGVLCRRWRVGALDATLGIAVVCLLLAVPPYLLGAVLGWWPSRLFQAPVAELLFQAVYQGGLAMLVAGLAYTQVLQTFGPVRTTMLTALVPPLAALGAVPLLGEPLGWTALGGLLCVALGLFVGLRAATPAPLVPAVAPALAPTPLRELRG